MPRDEKLSIEATLMSSCDLRHLIGRIWVAEYSYGDWNSSGSFKHLISNLYWEKRCH